jgi:hypothetical protein
LTRAAFRKLETYIGRLILSEKISFQWKNSRTYGIAKEIFNDEPKSPLRSPPPSSPAQSVSPLSLALADSADNPYARLGSVRKDSPRSPRLFTFPFQEGPPPLPPQKRKCLICGTKECSRAHS